MLKELFISFLIVLLLLYIFYVYLEWCNQYSPKMRLYSQNDTKFLVSTEDKLILDKYGNYLLPVYLADTYKPIRFWLLYYTNKYIT